MCKAGQRGACQVCWLLSDQVDRSQQKVLLAFCLRQKQRSLAHARSRCELRAQGGQWCQTISTLEAMQAAGAEPHAAVISSVVDALWHTGIVWAQAKAALLFQDSIRCAALQTVVLQP